MTTNQKAYVSLQQLGYDTVNIRKAILILTGITQTELAKKAGISRVTLTFVMSGRHRSPYTERKIASILDIPKEILFDN